ncbi:hypothetical protein PGT21_018189 [Puccinia graminis f. sp. tritici]|uniref:Uncharacterized protein n=1 Tax=Puccinia graminis f. sp. tritici TaxID=56615 RepID=A0A5B0M1G5_PUCGR|nr:hypothetical protein PGT21_018189 [Puccinia graminis f. sp. tritici]KAA1089780.1 hypothetical protein PGTUg99_010537 [Puccinia graminis f. sp. tritici]
MLKPPSPSMTFQTFSVCRSDPMPSDLCGTDRNIEADAILRSAPGQTRSHVPVRPTRRLNDLFARPLPRISEECVHPAWWTGKIRVYPMITGVPVHRFRNLLR